MCAAWCTGATRYTPFAQHFKRLDFTLSKPKFTFPSPEPAARACAPDLGGGAGQAGRLHRQGGGAAAVRQQGETAHRGPPSPPTPPSPPPSTGLVSISWFSQNLSETNYIKSKSEIKKQFFHLVHKSENFT